MRALRPSGLLRGLQEVTAQTQVQVKAPGSFSGLWPALLAHPHFQSALGIHVAPLGLQRTLPAEAESPMGEASPFLIHIPSPRPPRPKADSVSADRCPSPEPCPVWLWSDSPLLSIKHKVSGTHPRGNPSSIPCSPISSDLPWGKGPREPFCGVGQHVAGPLPLWALVSLLYV